MLVSLIPILSLVTFPGGTASDFATSLSAASHQNVVFIQSKPVDVPAVTYDPADLNEMSRTFRSKAGIQIAPGADLSLHDGLIPEKRISQVEEKFPDIEWREIKPAEIAGGKISFTTGSKERLDPRALTRAPLSKPLKIHWFFDQTPLAVSVREMPEADFLRYVSKALGGRLINNAKEYRIDLDGEAIRGRAIQTLNRWPDKRSGFINFGDQTNRRDTANMLAAVLSEIPRASLEAALETPETKADFAVSSQGKVAKNLEVCLKKMAANSRGGEQGIKTPVGTLGYDFFFDGKSRFVGTLHAGFTFELGIMRFNEESGQDSLIKLTFSLLETWI